MEKLVEWGLAQQAEVKKTKTKLNSIVWVRERTIQAERPPIFGKVIANFLRIEGCHVVSVTNPYGCILDFLDRSRYFSIK
jgi:hypothetical protein